MKFLAAMLLSGVTFAFKAGALTTTNPANAIVVAVNDTIITSQQVEQAIVNQAELLNRQLVSQAEVLGRQYSSDALEYNSRLARLNLEFRRRFALLESEGISNLITRQLILHEFKTSGGVVPENYIEDKIRERIRDHYGDRVTMTKSLQARGITFETWRQQTREEIIIEIMRYQNISSDKIIISPQRIETFYAQHLDDFRLDDQVKLRMIVLNRLADSLTSETLKMAQEILDRIEGGAPSPSEIASGKGAPYKPLWR